MPEDMAVLIAQDVERAIQPFQERISFPGGYRITS
jgi:hypothetical protein